MQHPVDTGIRNGYGIGMAPRRPREHRVEVPLLDASPTFHPPGVALDLASVADATFGGAGGVEVWRDESWWQDRAGDWWFRWVALDRFPFAVHLRLGLDDGALTVTGLHVESPRGEEITSSALRDISFPLLLERLGAVLRGVERHVPPATRNRRGPKAREAELAAIRGLLPRARLVAPKRVNSWLQKELARLGFTPSERTIRRRIEELDRENGGHK
jgi:hypothetical protein